MTKKSGFCIAVAVCIHVWFGAFSTPSVAGTVLDGETVRISGIPNIVIRAAAARGSIILLTGGDGKLGVLPGAEFTDNETNVLIRNHGAFAEAGFDVLLLEFGTNLADAVQMMPAPVTVVATSAGTPRSAEGILAGATPERLVLVSGFLSPASGPSESVMDILQHPGLLPATLIIHHRSDHCRFTKPGGVEPFLEWADGRAELLWIDGGKEEGNPCRYAAHHGFAGQDAELVDAIVDFASSDSFR